MRIEPCEGYETYMIVGPNVKMGTSIRRNNFPDYFISVYGCTSCMNVHSERECSKTCVIVFFKASANPTPPRTFQACLMPTAHRVSASTRKNSSSYGQLLGPQSGAMIPYSGVMIL